MIDVSDGLAIDLWRVLDASGCGAEIDKTALAEMIHADAYQLAKQDGLAPRDHALYDGEDFELLVALPSSTNDEQLRTFGLSRIGRFIKQAGCRLIGQGETTEIQRRGWEHFR